MRMGAVKTAGRGTEPEDSPAAEKTVTVGRAAIFCELQSCELGQGEHGEIEEERKEDGS